MADNLPKVVISRIEVQASKKYKHQPRGFYYRKIYQEAITEEAIRANPLYNFAEWVIKNPLAPMHIKNEAQLVINQYNNL